MNKIVLGGWKLLSSILPVTASRIMFYKTNHKRLNLKRPEWFDEKLQYLKLFKYANDPLVSECADKYSVRNYVKKCGCPEILNKMIFFDAFKHVEEIPWNDLPNQFVIKCTHGCHMNIICRDKTNFDYESAKKKLNGWLKEKQWKEQAELHYRNIKPRIIVEEYIPFCSKERDKLPLDYKIYCFNGEPKIVLVCSERASKVQYNYYDLKWNKLDNIVKNNVNSKRNIEKPKSLEKMLEYCKMLTSGDQFPFVRVDFYDMDGSVIFGEMTFTPSGCNDDDYTIEGQIFMGKLLNLRI